MKQLLFCIFLLLLEGCSSNQPPAVSGQIDELPAIYPDYIDVTIPQSIAPLNFAVQTEGKACAVFTTEGYAFTVYASNGAFSIPNTDWEKNRNRDCNSSGIYLLETDDFRGLPTDRSRQSTHLRKERHWREEEAYQSDRFDIVRLPPVRVRTWCHWNNVGRLSH